MNAISFTFRERLTGSKLQNLALQIRKGFLPIDGFKLVDEISLVFSWIKTAVCGPPTHLKVVMVPELPDQATSLMTNPLS